MSMYLMALPARLVASAPGVAGATVASHLSLTANRRNKRSVAGLGACNTIGTNTAARHQALYHQFIRPAIMRWADLGSSHLMEGLRDSQSVRLTQYNVLT
jgi:hypothetical protein